MSKSRWVWIIAILLLGAVSRILYLSEQSLWVDEGYAFYHAHFPSLLETLARDTHPPLYFAMLRLWSEIAGQSELALRWLSVLPSMLSIAFIYQLAREVLHHRKLSSQYASIPILAMLMLALADAENFLAQEVRHYTWLVLFVLCSMWMFLRWLRTHRSRTRLLWIGFTIAMVYTHYITAFIGIVQGLYALFILRGQQRFHAIGGLIISALALSPWLLIVGTQQLGNDGANWSVALTDVVIRDIQVKYFTEQWSLIIGLFLLGCLTIFYREQDTFRISFHRTTLLLLGWLIVPFVLTVMVNEILPFLQPRRLTQWTPVIALLVAFGLGNIRQPVRAVLMGVLLVYGIVQVDFYRVKPDWHTIAGLTARYTLPGDLVLTDIDGGDYQMGYYLTRELPDGKLLDDSVRYESLKIQRDFYSETYHEWLPQTIDAHDTVWLMYWSNDLSGFGWLDNLGFQETAHFTYLHDGGASGEIVMRIFRFDRLDASDPPVATFENGMILQSAYFDKEDLRLDLLWTHEESLGRDYTISAKLLDENGVLVAQDDSQPQLDQRPTTSWQADEFIYSPHEMQLREDLSELPSGDLQAVVQVYYREGDQIVNVETEDDEAWATIPHRN